MAELRDAQERPSRDEDGEVAISNPWRTRSWRYTLAGLLIAAFAIRMIAWALYPNIHHPDEIFQYQEQAFRLVEGYGVVPWEYIGGARSWLMPGVLAIPLFSLEAVGLGPASWHALTAAVMAGLSLSVVAVAAAYGYRLWDIRGAVLAGGFATVWYEFVYFAPKTLPSPVATHLLLWGVFLWLVPDCKPSRRRLVVIGLLLGLALVIRPHIGLGILVIAVGITRHEGLRRAIPAVIGGVALAIALQGAIDLANFDYPFQWFANALQFNLVEEVASTFGTSPWYWYLFKTGEAWLQFAPLFLVLFVAGIPRVALLGGSAVAITATHMLIAHKEYRFIYPAVIFALIACSVGLVRIIRAALRRSRNADKRLSLVIACVVLSLGLGGVARSLVDPVLNWSGRSADLIEAFERLRDDSALKSLLLDDVNWALTPGYSTLRRNVPIRLLEDDEGLSDLAGSYTHLLSQQSPDSISADHDMIGSWTSEQLTFFLYRYSGSFEGPPDTEINEQLRSDWERFLAGESESIGS